MHELEQAAELLAKEECKDLALKLFKRISREIRLRRNWITAREEQIKDLQSAKAEIIAAYNAGDEEALNVISSHIPVTNSRA